MTPMNASNAILTHKRGPITLSLGCRLDVAKGQRSRYAYTAHENNRMVLRCRATRVLSFRLDTTAMNANRDAYACQGKAVYA